MSLYLDETGKRDKKPARRGLLRHTNLLVPAIALLLHYAFKCSYIPLYILAISLLLLVNVLLLARHSVELHFGLLSFFMAVLVYAVLGTFSVNTALSSLVDLSILLSVLLTYTYYRYAVKTHIIFKQYTPFVVLASTVIGIYLEVSHPLRYSLLTALDAIVSSVVSTSVENTALKYTASLLFFMLLYSSPLVDVSPLSLVAFASLHLARNVLMYGSSESRKSAVGHVLGLDMVLKPLVVAFT